MKTLLYIFLSLWIIAGTDIHENISLERPGETNGVVLLAFLGDKLPFTVLGCMVDHVDTEIMHMTLFDKPYTHIGTLLVPVNDTHLAIDASRFRNREVGSMGCLNGDGLVGSMVNVIVLSEAGHSYQSESKYEKQPFHGANITING